MKTLVCIMIYGCIVSAPAGGLLVLISILYGKLTGRPLPPCIDDERPIDIAFHVGLLIMAIGAALGFFGLVMALVFVAPTLSEYIQFISSLF